MSSKNSMVTVPYHLRPHKAIERNLFLKVLKMLDRSSDIDLKDYRYVGFGAAFLEDFKMLHTEFGITNMHSVEMDSCAFSRQTFNKPYSFIELFETSSTKYITGDSFKYDKNQIIWLDYASKEYAQQFQDLESLAEKIEELDVLKITFNCNLHDNCNYSTLFKKFTEEETLKTFTPTWLKLSDIANDFSMVIRSMAFKAIQRGFSKANKKLVFNNLTAFTYADGQKMTTMTGIITKEQSLNKLLIDTGLKKWPFLNLGDQDKLTINGYNIKVPVMTISERLIIDKKLKKYGPKKIADSLNFKYGDDSDPANYHEQLIEGYIKYYNYLPYYSRVTY